MIPSNIIKSKRKKKIRINGYQLTVKTKKAKKGKDRRSGSASQTNEAEDKHITITKDFSAWMASLHGEDNINEATIMAQFASGVERQPSMAVPIREVERHRVPRELAHLSSMPSKKIPDPHVPRSKIYTLPTLPKI